MLPKILVRCLTNVAFEYRDMPLRELLHGFIVGACLRKGNSLECHAIAGRPPRET